MQASSGSDGSRPFSLFFQRAAIAGPERSQRKHASYATVVIRQSECAVVNNPQKSGFGINQRDFSY
jgi:hypothetical protein